MRFPVKEHRFFAFFPPYHVVEPVSDPSVFPSSVLPLRGAALIWNLTSGEWGGGFQAVRRRPPGVALFVLMPPAAEMAGMDRLLELMEKCRPHSILPHMTELNPGELVAFLRRFPSDLPLEVVDYLAWRGIEVDTDTRRLIRKTLESSADLRTVGGLARSLYMSRRGLGRRFTSRGLPAPSHWLHFGRVLRASIMLQKPEITLYFAANELGYADGFSLSNQMSRLTGLRPSIMRECFGWEWIVESWLRQEALEGYLSPNLRKELFPTSRGRSPLERGILEGTGTDLGGHLRVAESPGNRGRSTSR